MPSPLHVNHATRLHIGLAASARPRPFANGQEPSLPRPPTWMTQPSSLRISTIAARMRAPTTSEPTLRPIAAPVHAPSQPPHKKPHIRPSTTNDPMNPQPSESPFLFLVATFDLPQGSIVLTKSLSVGRDQVLSPANHLRSCLSPNSIRCVLRDLLPQLRQGQRVEDTRRAFMTQRVDAQHDPLGRRQRPT